MKTEPLENLPDPKPKIVCLCGSSRFYKEYQIAEYQETMAGRIYLSIGFYPHAAEEMHGEGVGHNSMEKVALDELHKRKIDLADEVLVLNVGGYIGDSTRSEVAYAIENGKPVRWLEPDSAWHPYFTNKCSGVVAVTPHFRMGQKAWVPRYRDGQPDEPMEATVGEIKIEISKEGVTEQFMCGETGIGTGTLYTMGESIFDTEEECRAACIADFVPENPKVRSK